MTQLPRPTSPGPVKSTRQPGARVGTLKEAGVAYSGSITTTGKSGAVRLEKAFFRSHPEFQQQAKIRAHVIGKGYVLLEVDTVSEAAGDDIDPVMGAFLAFRERDLVERPEQVGLLAIDDLAALLGNVRPMADDEALPEDFEL